jgi:elongator complex protein 3
VCPEYQSFRPERYERELTGVIGELRELAELDERSFNRILRRYPKDGAGLFSKSEIVRGFRHLKDARGWAEDEERFLERIRMKPIRTSSGVAPVTVLTKPFPCPGECIFCPSDVRMPKSYLSDEPGAQRADQHRFDPYEQTLSRLRTYHYNGHRVDKIELIVLGGTWSFYPEGYQVWFVKRCFEALNAVERGVPSPFNPSIGKADVPPVGGTETRPLRVVDGRALRRRSHSPMVGLKGEASSLSPKNYNQVIGDIERAGEVDWVEGESATWEELEAVQLANETAAARCVGLSLETRPDHLSDDEVLRLRRLGATKVQIGYQSLSDEVLALNKRGHDVAATRRAMRLLRGAGFKIHAHWMPNLYGSSPAADIADFERLFADSDFRPDELKIYPCSLIESAELMAYYEAGEWRPYTHGELLEVLTSAMEETPEYCRLTRVIRDIPGTDIVDGNRVTNFRELAEAELARESRVCRDIRAREIRHEPLVEEELELTSTEYRTSVGRELFLQYVTTGDRLAAFLRLSLPGEPVKPAEVASSAMIREVHVYGVLTGLGESGNGRSQHAGLGTRLIERAAEIAGHAGFSSLAVISSIGTREYYRRLGFGDGELYQHLEL